MKRSCYLLIASLFATWLLLMGCSAEFFSLALSNHTQADDLFTQFIEKNLGTDWYGNYIQDCKVGYLKSTTRLERGPNSTSYTIQVSATIHIPSQQAETDEMKIHMVAVFSAQPPYSMIHFSDRMIHKDDNSETKIVRASNGYAARITQGGETRTHMIGTLNSTGGYQAIATDEEIEKNLAETTHILKNHPKIIGLTHKAVCDAKTPTEVVNRLVKFVCHYIEDDYTANPLTLLDIIAKKRRLQ